MRLLRAPFGSHTRLWELNAFPEAFEKLLPG